MVHKAALLALAFSLAGCAPSLYSEKMSAEQLHELVKDKNAQIGCGTVETPYKINTVFLNLDKGIIPNGKVTVKANCEVLIENQK